jgi:hypothetical protein
MHCDEAATSSHQLHQSDAMKCRMRLKNNEMLANNFSFGSAGMCTSCNFLSDIYARELEMLLE